jgi:tRNA (guanine26-N2/guanine27-N2)-dimethyltransferase
MKLVEHAEGRTRLLVPPESLTSVPPPTSPVFFNPAASLNRDVSVAITATAGGSTFCDSMAGVGARGVRVAHEVKGVRVTLVDFNRQALQAARRAAELNGVQRKCEFAESETSAYLFSRFGRDRRFDCVDVDPFGTPVRQFQGALSATRDGGILSMTATDTAVLCGVHSDVCRRRYGARPLNNHFHHETAVRILVGAVARVGGSIDIGVSPLAAHSTKHYLRAFVRVTAGASQADRALKGLGYIAWCPACGHTSPSPPEVGACESCGRKTRVTGPLWLGGLTEPPTLRRAARKSVELGLGSAVKVLDSLSGVDDFPPWSYSIERICSSLGVATVPEAEVYRVLTEEGYRAMRTPFEKTGIKTEARFREVVGAVKSVHGRPAPRSTGEAAHLQAHLSSA